MMGQPAAEKAQQVFDIVLVDRRSTQFGHLLGKVLMNLDMGLNEARVAVGGDHQLGFVREVIGGVVDQIGEDLAHFHTFLAGLSVADDPVDDAYQFLVFGIHLGFAGDVAFVPDKSVHDHSSPACGPRTRRISSGLVAPASTRSSACWAMLRSPFWRTVRRISRMLAPLPMRSRK